MSATDLIAVVATLKKLGAPKRLSLILEGESLLNDGTGIVFFTLSLAFLAGNGMTVGVVALNVIAIVGVGLLIGTVTGLMVFQISKRIDAAMIEIALTTIAACAALAPLNQMSRDRLQKSSIVPTLRQEYDAMIQSIEQNMAEIEPEQQQPDAEETKWVRRHLLLVEKRRVIETFHEGRMDHEMYEKLLGDIDARLLKVETEL